jgi:hypothetical protein
MDSHNRLIELQTKEDFFNQINKRSKSIIYLQVDWSNQERLSRLVLKQAINLVGQCDADIFKINCSDLSNKFIEDWLADQQAKKKGFKYGGYGELLLVADGTVLDFILAPGQIGLEKTQQTLSKWCI